MNQIKSTLKDNGFKTGDYIFSYSELTGFSYLLDSPYPTNNVCWFPQKGERNNCRILSDFFENNKKVNLFFMIDNRQPFSNSFKTCLANFGYDFDNDFSKVKELTVHFCNEESNISIYAPKY